MKFKNTKEVPLAFVFHGEKHTVGPKGEWECPARLAFAVAAMGLPLAPDGDVEAAIAAERPQASRAFRDETATFVNGTSRELSFRFHGATHTVAAGATWACPARLAFAVGAAGLPLTRVADEPEPPKAVAPKGATKPPPKPAEVKPDAKSDEPEPPKAAPKG